MKTFFLAPKEKGYFVLNDIFRYIEDEPVHQYLAILLAHSTFMLLLYVLINLIE